LSAWRGQEVLLVLGSIEDDDPLSALWMRGRRGSQEMIGLRGWLRRFTVGG
jgi:hypothetical protein